MSSYLDLNGLSRYDGKIKALITAEAAARANADSALSGRVSTLENAGYITKSVSNLDNYRTNTWIADNLYTKTQVDSLISPLTATTTINVTTKDNFEENMRSVPQNYYGTGFWLVPDTSYGIQTGNSYVEYIVSRTGAQGAYAYNWERLGDTTPNLANYVPNTRTVNGHALSSNVTITKADVGLGDTANGAQVNVLEGVQLNGTDLTITNKKVNINLSSYATQSWVTSGYVAKESGKGLSSNDFTDAYEMALRNALDPSTGKGVASLYWVSENYLSKDAFDPYQTKLNGIAAGAQVNVIEVIKVNGSAVSVTSPKTVSLTIPTKTSDLTNDSGFITGVTSITNSEIDALFA